MLFVVEADADRQNVELGAGRDPAVGEELHLSPLLGDDGEADGAWRLHLLQDQRQHLGAEEARDVGDREALGRRVPAVVDVPTKDAMGARGGGIEALRRPGDPVGRCPPAA